MEENSSRAEEKYLRYKNHAELDDVLQTVLFFKSQI